MWDSVVPGSSLIPGVLRLRKLTEEELGETPK
jgi:hypothetical protein